MKRARFTEEQMKAILKERPRAGAKVADLCRRRGSRRVKVGPKTVLGTELRNRLKMKQKVCIEEEFRFLRHKRSY